MPMRKSMLALAVLLSMGQVFGATPAWSQRAKDATHSYFTTAPKITAPSVFWVLDDIPAPAYGSPNVVVGANNDIYCVQYDGTYYSIVELNRKGQVQRTYYSNSAVPVTSLAVSATNLYADFGGTSGAFHAWTLGDTNILWSKSDDYIGSVIALDDGGNVYILSDSTVYSFTNTGTSRWTQSLTATSVGVWPALASGALIVTYDNKMVAYNSSGGSQRWFIDMATWHPDWQYFTMPVVGLDGTIWAGRVAYDLLQNYVALDPSSGNPIMQLSPPYSGSLLFSLTSSKMLIFAGEGHLVGGTYDTVAKTVTQNFSVNAGFPPATTVTVATDRMYQGRSNGTLYAYKTTDGSQTWSLPLGLGGAYGVGIIAADQYGTLYIPTSDGRLAVVGESPVAVASGPAFGLPGVPVTFSSSGSGPGIPTDTITYSWDFGDLTSSTDANPTKTYTANGVYNVVLTVTANETGAVGTDTIQIIIDDQPPAITLTDAKLWGTVLDDTSTPPTINVGGTDVPVNPTLHTWVSGWVLLETSGPTDIDVVASDASGNTRTVTLTVAP